MLLSIRIALARCVLFVSSTRIAHLTSCVLIDFQLDGCDGTPLYGTRDGPLSYCQAHKRTGLYTVRDGVLYVATRDGSGTLLCCTRTLEAKLLES